MQLWRVAGSGLMEVTGIMKIGFLASLIQEEIKTAQQWIRLVNMENGEMYPVQIVLLVIMLFVECRMSIYALIKKKKPTTSFREYLGPTS